MGDGDGVGVSVGTIGVGETLCAVTQWHKTSGITKWRRDTFIVACTVLSVYIESHGQQLWAAD